MVVFSVCAQPASTVQATSFQGLDSGECGWRITEGELSLGVDMISAPHMEFSSPHHTVLHLMSYRILY